MDEFATAAEIYRGAGTTEYPTARLRWIKRDRPATDGESNFLVRESVLQQAWVVEGEDFVRSEWRDVPVEAEGQG